MTARRPRKLAAAFARLALDRRAVLDAACGPGTYLAHFGPGSFGLDRDPRALADARARGCAVLVRELDRPGWSADLPPFEAVWLCDCLVHLADPAAFLGELRTACAAGTPVAVVEWVWPAGGRLARALASAVPGARAFWAHPEHRHRFTEPALRRLLVDAGFEPEARLLHSLPRPLRTGPLALPFAPWLPPRTLVARAR